MGPLETAVMQRLWDKNAPQTVRDVQEDIATEREIAYTTVMTVMDNLHKKGLLTRSRHGRAYIYSPKESQEEYTASLLEDVLAESGDRHGVLMRFVDRLDDDVLESLRQIVQDPLRGDDRQS